MTRRSPKNPFLRPLELALAQRFGWQPGGVVREQLLHAVAARSVRIDMDEVGYCRAAVESSAELEALAEDVAPAESRFFGPSEQIEALRERVLPALAAARERDRALRLWSVGCANGEEVFTLAILLREAVHAVDDRRIELLGTDVRGKALATAGRGRYRVSSIRTIDPVLRNKYFIGVEAPGPDRECEILPIVRRMATFRRGNVCDSRFWPAVRGPFDVVLCQNLLLYFHPRAVELVCTRLARTVAPDGYLVVSPMETQLVTQSMFAPVVDLPDGFFVTRPAADVE